jgi:hypothetical protein
MLLNNSPSPHSILSRLGTALRRARKSLGRENSDDFGKAIGVSGRTLRVLEASGKGSTESLVRALLTVCPQALDNLIKELEAVEPAYTSVDEALQAKNRAR